MRKNKLKPLFRHRDIVIICLGLLKLTSAISGSSYKTKVLYNIDIEPELAHRNAKESDFLLLNGAKNSIPLSLLSFPALPLISRAAPNVTSFIETPWLTTLSPIPVQEFSSGYMYLVSPVEKQQK